MNDTTSTSPANVNIGIDYGPPEGDRTVAMIRHEETGECCEIPLWAAEYLQAIEKERDWALKCLGDNGIDLDAYISFHS